MTNSRLQHRGSFESSIMLKSDGFRADLFKGRIATSSDNLFNLQWDETSPKQAFAAQHGLSFLLCWRTNAEC